MSKTPWAESLFLVWWLMDSFSCTHPNEWGLPSPTLPQFIFLRSEPHLKAPMAGAICEQSRGWCNGSLLVVPLSSGRFPKPDPPHPGTQGRGGVKTWRAFAWSLWACNHLLPAHAQLATFDPTKFELKRGWWLRSSSLLWRSGGGWKTEEEQGLTGPRLIETWQWHGNKSHCPKRAFCYTDVFQPKNDTLLWILSAWFYIAEPHCVKV